LINNGFPNGFRVLCWNCQFREKLKLMDIKRIVREDMEEDKNWVKRLSLDNATMILEAIDEIKEFVEKHRRE